MLGMKLYDAAGRTAYLAGFHAAQALISEKTGRSVKTHKGVHRELHRLTRDEQHLDPELRVFLGATYSLKAIADYETGPGSQVSPERAATAVEVGKRFVARMAELVEADAGRG
jgi:uncharacterized protein (UPF0332 family)